jgi:hypothetical protein
MNPQHQQVSDAWRAHRACLVDLAFRMLGDVGAAEDVVQEAFFRLLQAPIGDVNDERGWLIVVTSRLCLDHIKSASSRRERPQDMAEHCYRDRGRRPSIRRPGDPRRRGSGWPCSSCSNVSAPQSGWCSFCTTFSGALRPSRRSVAGHPPAAAGASGRRKINESTY